MSDIFVSYKREEQSTARKLAEALENEGWTVWWDPKLRAGERFDDVIEAALEESKCVVVMWSKLSVKSKYVKDEATYALNRNKIVPVKIEDVDLPFRFDTLHTPRLVGWDGSKNFPEFQTLMRDIAQIVPLSTARNQDRVKAQNRQPLQTKKSKTTDSKTDSANQSTASTLARERPQLGMVFRDTLKDGSQGPEMVVVPVGEFQMGSVQGSGAAAEQPVHTVHINKPFAIGRYPITFAEYDQFASATNRELPGDKGWGRGRQPVINVSWTDAVKYANWLSLQTGKRYRLPSEAEWEYAARAGTDTAYWWGDEVQPGVANFYGSDSRWGGKQTSPVGSFPANPFGLHDTAGNVWELIQDTWHDNYDQAPTDGSAWEEGNGGRLVIRGGSWGNGPEYLRSSFRNRDTADDRNTNIGFRLAQT
jgi:formylglycine-generating enzyme required for sulfatase activity